MVPQKTNIPRRSQNLFEKKAGDVCHQTRDTILQAMWLAESSSIGSLHWTILPSSDMISLH